MTMDRLLRSSDHSRRMSMLAGGRVWLLLAAEGGCAARFARDLEAARRLQTRRCLVDDEEELQPLSSLSASLAADSEGCWAP